MRCKEKMVQIPESMFLDLYQWHVCGEHNAAIEEALIIYFEKKLDAMIRHKAYGEYIVSGGNEAKLNQYIRLKSNDEFSE